MNKNLKELIELAKIDKEIDSFTPQLEAIDKKLRKSQERVKEAQEEIKNTQASIDENRAKIAIYEEQIITLSEQLKNIAKKSKEVATEKEMKALSLEEDIAKEKIAFANEEIERIGKANEKKEALLAELNENANTLQVAAQESLESANAHKEMIESSRSSLFASREGRVNGFDQKVLAFYEKIKKWAQNSAVVPVKKQACYGCFMKISDKSYSEVIKSEEIITCPHCGRILFIEEEN